MAVVRLAVPNKGETMLAGTRIHLLERLSEWWISSGIAGDDRAGHWSVNGSVSGVA